VVPAVTVYVVVSWKSIHEKLVPMFTALDCASNAPGVFPFTAYSAAVAFPEDVPLMYAMMSVIVPVVAALKYETDWALASFLSLHAPIAEFPKEHKVVAFASNSIKEQQIKTQVINIKHFFNSI
jgi:hypothetical protein